MQCFFEKVQKRQVVAVYKPHPLSGGGFQSEVTRAGNAAMVLREYRDTRVCGCKAF